MAVPPERPSHVQVDPLILMCAFRYALGRKSYITDVIAEALEQHREALGEHWRAQVVGDIERAVELEQAGMSQDAQRWQRCAAVLRA